MGHPSEPTTPLSPYARLRFRVTQFPLERCAVFNGDDNSGVTWTCQTTKP
jgi:hypothetical protein